MPRSLLVLFVAAWSLAAPRPAAAVVFESGPVRPLALSPDGTRLFAVNTPDSRLEIFAVDAGGLTPVGSVPVGLEPVAVAARSDAEVWVVNHLSDSVSIVDVAAMPPRVVRTLLVGDEPRDVVFAGRRRDGAFGRAFVTTARRGQNLPADLPAALRTPGMPRALVWVFAAAALPADGAPEAVVALFGDTPRALAVTPDGGTVYAAVFHSGNQTTSVSEGAVCDGGAAAPPCGVDGVQVPGGLPGAQMPGGLPAPNVNVQNQRGPEVGLIVKQDPLSGVWQDERGRNWNNAVRFELPDLDVFALDALADPPVERDAFAHVGTVLFNMAMDPGSGTLFVSNTEARNEVRFEGPGTGASTVRGHLHEARISVIDANGVRARHLNKHITALPAGYRTAPMPAAVKAASLATPLDLVIASDGTLYVAAFGSSAIGRFAAAALADDSFTPEAATQIAVSGGGPCGLALDEAHNRLYVLTRFDNAVKVIDTTAAAEIAQHPLHDAEPARVREGRRVLYDARFSSGTGEASCASCHVFADFDSLAWDLGNPDDDVLASNNPVGTMGGRQPFHPLKGPMTTQTLRGMADAGPMHWRGDRTGGSSGGDALDERLAFVTFNPAFPGLLGRDEGVIANADMQAFADFVLAIALPPNPVRRLDNALRPEEARARSLYFGRVTDVIDNCNGCHTLDPSRGFFGTSGRTTFENETQEFKVPHLRNAYQKVGMFGMPDVSFLDLPTASRMPQGAQVRGFGFLHDGSIPTLVDFLHATVFSLSEGERHDLEQFVHAFDTTFAPIVGQQVTLTAANAPEVAARIDLLIARARTSFVLVDQPQARECDLVVQGTVDGLARGFLLDAASGAFRSDRAAEAPLAAAALRGLAAGAGQALTFTCAPPGDGLRLGLDRDGDGALDRDEFDAGSDPADPDSTPGNVPTPSATPPASPTPTPLLLGCTGDCNGNAEITIAELLRAVAIALGEQSAATCRNVDRDGDGAVSVAELLRAVGTALDGCEQGPPTL